MFSNIFEVFCARGISSIANLIPTKRTHKVIGFEAFVTNLSSISVFVLEVNLRNIFSMIIITNLKTENTISKIKSALIYGLDI